MGGGGAMQEGKSSNTSGQNHNNTSSEGGAHCLGLQSESGCVLPTLLPVSKQGQVCFVLQPWCQSVNAQPELAHHLWGVGCQSPCIFAMLVPEKVQQQNGVGIVKGKLHLHKVEALQSMSSSAYMRQPRASLERQRCSRWVQEFGCKKTEGKRKGGKGGESEITVRNSDLLSHAQPPGLVIPFPAETKRHS